MENNEKKLYYVSNSYLVAYLLADGFLFVKTEVYEGKENRRTVDFLFESTKELHNAIQDYRQNKFLIKYGYCLKQVKMNVYEALRGELIEL